MAIHQDAYTFLCRFARRHKRKPWSPEQAIGQASIHGIAFSDARHWGPVFNQARRDGVIKHAGMFPRESSNGSLRPGWVGI